jgi:hypothetical protein
LNFKISSSLKEEGKARELVRKIQIERRKLKMNLDDLVNVNNDWIPEDKKLFSYIKERALAKELNKGGFKVKPVKD